MSREPNPIAHWIALNRLPALGPIRLAQALQAGYTPEQLAYKVPPERLMEITSRRKPEYRSDILAVRVDLRRQAEKELKRCQKTGVDLIPIDHPSYPALLREIPAPPLLLYVQGSFVTDRLRVALVGSRRCTRYGLRVASELAGELAANGVEVVSGGARGIDTAAHEGALAAGGTTTAILGSGLEAMYPLENKELFAKISACGALVSEFPLTMAPAPGHFPRRNRLISGLCAAVVVVEAAVRSGSLITARHAMEQGRDVLAVPGPISSATSTGCNQLLRDGVKPVLGVNDILEELSSAFGSPAHPPMEPAEDSDLDTNVEIPNDLTKDERKVLDFLDPVEPAQLDHMAEEIPMRVGPMQVALFGLEARRLVEQLPGRYYLRRP